MTAELIARGTYVSFTAQTGGHETLLRLREKAEAGRLTAEDRGRVSALDAYFDMKLGILSSLLADGMLSRLAISRDAGPYDVSFGGLQHGVELAVQAGLTPLQAIDCVTSTAADACGIGEEVGRLTPGRVADLLVVGGDATTDVSRLWDVQAVYQEGRLVAPLSAVSPLEARPVDLLPAPRAAALPDC